ncbi:MAG: hypothetical protein VX436_02275 [Planctomycetota bacterium]|nr:hypothetical protein [Planctomycetota bacterium]
MVTLMRTRLPIQAYSKFDRHRGVGNIRAHSSQDSVAPKVPVNCQKQGYQISINDELEVTMVVEIDMPLLTGDLDQDIEILNFVA